MTKNKYEESGSLSPRVQREIVSDNYSVTYTVKQVKQEEVVVKRYMMLSDESDKSDEEALSVGVSLSFNKLELNSLQEALDDNTGNGVFLWDIFNRKNSEIHTLCVVKINYTLYLIDPNNSAISNKFVGWINDALIDKQLKAQNIKHIKVQDVQHKYKDGVFYQSKQEEEKRDCIDIAFKIAQRIKNNFEKIEASVSPDNPDNIENEIRETIKHLSNITKVNTDLGLFDEVLYNHLQSSDLELSNSSLNLISKYSLLEQAKREPINKINFKKMNGFLDKFTEKNEKIAKLEKDLKKLEEDHMDKKSKYDTEKQKILAERNSVIAAPTETIQYDENGLQHVHKAIYDDNIEEFKKLILDESHPNRINYHTDKGGNVLHVACLYDRINFIKLIQKDHSSSFYSLLQEYDDQGRNPIHIAYYAGKTEAIDLLLEQKPDLIESTTKDGKNVLHIAALYNHIDLVEEIIKEHQDFLNAYDKNGWTPLHSAIYGGATEVVDYLLSEHPSCVSNTLDGKNLLHIAVLHEHDDIAKKIVDKYPSFLN